MVSYDWIASDGVRWTLNAECVAKQNGQYWISILKLATGKINPMLSGVPSTWNRTEKNTAARKVVSWWLAFNGIVGIAPGPSCPFADYIWSCTMVPCGVEFAPSSWNQFLLTLNRNPSAPEFYGIYSNRSLVCACKLAKVCCPRKILRDGYREWESVISAENGLCRSETAPDLFENFFVVFITHILLYSSAICITLRCCAHAIDEGMC